MGFRQTTVNQLFAVNTKHYLTSIFLNSLQRTGPKAIAGRWHNDLDHVLKSRTKLPIRDLSGRPSLSCLALQSIHITILSCHLLLRVPTRTTRGGQWAHSIKFWTTMHHITRHHLQNEPVAALVKRLPLAGPPGHEALPESMGSMLQVRNQPVSSWTH